MGAWTWKKVFTGGSSARAVRGVRPAMSRRDPRSTSVAPLLTTSETHRASTWGSESWARPQAHTRCGRSPARQSVCFGGAAVLGHKKNIAPETRASATHKTLIYSHSPNVTWRRSCGHHTNLPPRTVRPFVSESLAHTCARARRRASSGWAAQRARTSRGTDTQRNAALSLGHTHTDTQTHGWKCSCSG